MDSIDSVSRPPCAHARETRIDDIEDDLAALADFVEGQVKKKLVFGINKSGKRVFAENAKRYNHRVFDILRINDIPEDEYVGLLESWTRENIALIKNANRDVLGIVETELLRATRSGLRAIDLQKELRARLDYTESRCKLIARDQIMKMSGQIDHLKQVSIGVQSYTWRTSQDERVRPSHQAHQNKTYRWDSPPQDTGHPGQDIQCRCTADPDLESIED